MATDNARGVNMLFAPRRLEKRHLRAQERGAHAGWLAGRLAGWMGWVHSPCQTSPHSRFVVRLGLLELFPRRVLVLQVPLSFVAHELLLRTERNYFHDYSLALVVRTRSSTTTHTASVPPVAIKRKTFPCLRMGLFCKTHNHSGPCGAIDLVSSGCAMQCSSMASSPYSSLPRVVYRGLPWSSFIKCFFPAQAQSSSVPEAPYAPDEPRCFRNCVCRGARNLCIFM